MSYFPATWKKVLAQQTSFQKRRNDDSGRPEVSGSHARRLHGRLEPLFVHLKLGSWAAGQLGSWAAGHVMAVQPALRAVAQTQPSRKLRLTKLALHYSTTLRFASSWNLRVVINKNVKSWHACQLFLSQKRIEHIYHISNMGSSLHFMDWHPCLFIGSCGLLDLNKCLAFGGHQQLPGSM